MNSSVERLQEEHADKIDLIRIAADEVITDPKGALPVILATWENGGRYMEGGWDCTVLVDENGELIGKLNNAALKSSRHYREAIYPFNSEYPLRALGAIGLAELQMVLEACNSEGQKQQDSNY